MTEPDLSAGPQLDARERPIGTGAPEPGPAGGYGEERSRPGRWLHRTGGALRHLSRRPGLSLALAAVVIVLLWAVVPGLFTSQSATTGNPLLSLKPPSAQHWFGTDEVGRDLFTRVVVGSRLSIETAGIAVLIGLVAGTVIGLAAGFVRGPTDDILMRLMDVLMAIPSLLLAMAITVALGFGTVEVAIAVGVTSTAGLARVMRSEVLRIRSLAFVEAGFGSGSRWYTVLGRHVLLNSIGPVFTLCALEFGGAIMSVSALSFLGLGAGPPAPEWGSLVAYGRDYLSTSWWLAVLPGIVLVITVVAVNRIARALDGTGRIA